MDDIVVVKVRDSKANNHYFITWGRIFDRVNPKSLEVLIAAHAPKCGIKNPKSVDLCESLQEASKSRYFHEALFHMSQEKIPYGIGNYSRWCAKMKKSMLSGRQIFYCGVTKKTPGQTKSERRHTT
jgi:hypothetical protein